MGEISAITRWQNAGEFLRGYFHYGKEQIVQRVKVHAQWLQFAGQANGPYVLKPTTSGDSGQVGAGGSVGMLLACFAKALVVHHHNTQIGWTLGCNGGPAAPTHKHFSIPSQDQDLILRLGARQAQSYHRSPAHRAPQGKV